MEETQTAVQVEPSVIYQQDKAAIDIQISTAKAYPRSISRAMENAIALVSMNSEVASSCIYSLPRKGKAITGASVHLAKIIAQTWGNMRVEAKVTDISSTQITSQAIAFDLENNLAIKVEVKRSIIGRKGRYNEDMITVTGNAANAIALRNAVLAVVPKQVIDSVYKAAEAAIIGDISDENKLIARRQAVIERLKSAYGVTEEEILSAVGKTSSTHLDKDDLVTLIGAGQAIKDGDSTVDQIFRKEVKQDADKVAEEKEIARITKHIESATHVKHLAVVEALVGQYGLTELLEAKRKELDGK